MTRFEKWYIKRLLKKEFKLGIIECDKFERLSNCYILIRDSLIAEHPTVSIEHISEYLKRSFESTQLNPPLPEESIKNITPSYKKILEGFTIPKE